MRAIAFLVVLGGFLEAADPPAAIFDQAVKALSAGDYSAARQGFERVLAASPNHIGALQNLGLVYSRTERFDQAISLYRRALALNPNHKGVLMNLGLAYIHQESYADALPVFQTLIKADPGNLAVRELVATSEFYTGQVNAAVTHFEALVPQDPQNSDLLYLICAGYLKQNQPGKLQQLLHALNANTPAAEVSFIQCRAYDAGGHFDEAVDQCRKTLEVDPNFPGAHREMGKVLVSQRDPDASRELTAAIRQDPEDPEAQYLLGVALLQEDRFEEAAQRLERARQLRPGFWGNYFYLGKTKMQLQQPAAAVPLLQRAAELNPRASVLFYELGRALKATGKIEESARAMARVRELRAIELDSDAKALHKQ